VGLGDQDQAGGRKRQRVRRVGGQPIAQRALVEQLASDAGFSLDWQGLDADRNIAASAAIMRGDPVPMRTMLGELVRSP